jgi:hypothetical protein
MRGATRPTGSEVRRAGRLAPVAPLNPPSLSRPGGEDGRNANDIALVWGSIQDPCVTEFLGFKVVGTRGLTSVPTKAKSISGGLSPNRGHRLRPCCL